MQEPFTKETYVSLITEKLTANQYAVLSTISERGPRTRVIDYIHNKKLNFGFFSWEYTKKITEIKANSSVSLCINDIDIEGTAEIFAITDNSIKEYIEIYKKRLPDLYAIFSKLDKTLFIVIKPVISRMMVLQNKELINYHYNHKTDHFEKVKLSDWV